MRYHVPDGDNATAVSPGPGQQASRRSGPGRTATLFLGLLFFWLILSGGYAPQQLVSGVIVAAAMTAFWAHLLHSGPAQADVPLLQLVLQPRFVAYIARMLVEIVKSNWAVALIVLNPKMPISPQFVILRTKLKHNLTRVIYANSITLTPGTISVSLDGDCLIVHALTGAAAESVGNWPVETRVMQLERVWGR